MNTADDTATAPTHRYWAFISYSQRDAHWAQWLHGALEHYRVPRTLVGRHDGAEATPRRLFPIFRDRDELASAADLGQQIREALHASRNLIVICSPHAAASRWVDEEIRTFKAMGRAGRIFCLIVDGEPFASAADKGSKLECLPPALRFHIEPDGTLSDRGAEPLAADAREGKDGRPSALLKLVAGILNVRYDELRRRELERARRRRWRRVAAAAVAALTMLVIYAGLADADLAVPGGERLRRQIDRCNCSVFRPVPSPDEIARAASESRARLRGLMIAELAQEKHRVGADVSIWATAQIASAFYADRDAKRAELEQVTQMINAAFADDVLVVADGRHVGWKDWDYDPRPEAALWMMIAISSGLTRPDTIDADTRQAFLRHLSITQEIAGQFYSAGDGGWNTYIKYASDHHSVYPTALAVHALLKLRAAGLCWRNDCAALERMIRDGSAWLIRAAIDEHGAPGWRPFPDSDQLSVGDLDILVFSALMQAHRDVGIALPANIRAAAQRTLVDLRRRPYMPALQEISDRAFSLDADGRRRPVSFTTQMLWYPWSIEALELSLSPVTGEELTPGVERALRRSLGHVVISLSRDLATDMIKGPVWTRAETAYGLGQVR